MRTTGPSRRLCEWHVSTHVQTLIHSRKKAKTAHPDVGGSEDQMAALNEAYEVLSNEGTPQNASVTEYMLTRRLAEKIRQRRRSQ